jgi:hypothetical protein
MSDNPIAKMLMMLGGDTKDFERAIETSMRSLQRIERQSMQTGKALTKSLTVPIVAMGAASVYAYGQQEQAENRLRASLKMSGREVDVNFRRFKQFASEMQRLTVVGDEVTLKMLSMATAQGLSSDASERAVKNAIALSAATDMGAESALRYTMRLEYGEASMLKRYLPALSGIKDESKQAAMAQDILGGAFALAEAEAKGFLGTLHQTKNALGDLSEGFGEIVAQRAKPFITNLKDIVTELNGMDEGKRRLIVSMGGMLAVIGPVYLAVGSLATAIRILNLAMLKNPAIAVTAALAALGSYMMFAETKTSKYTRELREQIGVEGQLQGTLEERQAIQQRLIELSEKEQRVRQSASMRPGGELAVVGELKEIEQQVNALRSLHDESVMVARAKDEMNSQIEASGDSVEALTNQYEGLSGKIKIYQEQINAIINQESALTQEQIKQTQALREKQRALENELRLRRAIMEMGIDTSRVSSVDLQGVALDPSMAIDPQFVQRYKDFMSSMGNGLQQVKIDGGEIPETFTNIELAMMALDDIGSQFTSSFITGLDRMIMQGESFDDILRNIGRQLASSALQTALRIFLTGGLSGVSGFLGEGGGAFGAIKSILGFADGGRPPVGKVSMVGERGPELFVPDVSGTIIPNHAMGSSSMQKSAASASVPVITVENLVAALNRVSWELRGDKLKAVTERGGYLYR